MPPTEIYQLKVTLKGSQPPIWRRLQVPSDITLGQLHLVLQMAMGWHDSHLHHFIVSGVFFSVPSRDDFEPVRDERRFKLFQVAPGVKSKFVYEYDFGDSWEHAIVVEKSLAPEPGVHYPVCVKGKGACPPEDVGGVWGYADFLEALRDPAHAEHADVLEWADAEFDPEAFDLEAVNQLLRRLK